MSKAEVKINREMLMLEKENIHRVGESSNASLTSKVSKFNISDLNAKPCSESEGEENIETKAKAQTMIGLKPQDASYVCPKLLDELEVAIFSRVSCSEYWKLLFLNKQFSHLLKSREIFRARRDSGLVKPYVFMLSGDDTRWTMFDESFLNFKKLPEVPSDYCFFHCDKETISVGTQLMVVGKERESIVVWRYELEFHQWIKGPSMITPRVMYGSAASHGIYAYFAGGIKVIDNRIYEVQSLVERYNSETKTWTNTHEMHKKRKFCSGCFLRGKLYVIGGRDEKDGNLTCGESYDETTNSWKLIPDMLKDVTFTSLQSPSFIAVVSDNLYMIETYQNELRVYDINTNSWKKLGIVPVRADSVGGWGVAFKSLGDRLLLIGASSFRSMCETMTVYTCRPSPNFKELNWECWKKIFGGDGESV